MKVKRGRKEDKPIGDGGYNGYKDRKDRVGEAVANGGEVDIVRFSAALDRYVDGVPVKFSYKEFVDKLDEYFVKMGEGSLDVVSFGRVIKLNGRKACCLEGLCRFMGISIDMWEKYETADGYQEFHEVAKFARTLIAERLVVGGMEGLYNAGFVKFYLTNRGNFKQDKLPVIAKIIYNVNRGDHTPTIKKTGKDINIAAEEVREGVIVTDEEIRKMAIEQVKNDNAVPKVVDSIECSQFANSECKTEDVTVEEKIAEPCAQINSCTPIRREENGVD